MREKTHHGERKVSMEKLNSHVSLAKSFLVGKSGGKVGKIFTARDI